MIVVHLEALPVKGGDALASQDGVAPGGQFDANATGKMQEFARRVAARLASLVVAEAPPQAKPTPEAKAKPAAPVAETGSPGKGSDVPREIKASDPGPSSLPQPVGGLEAKAPPERPSSVPA